MVEIFPYGGRSSKVWTWGCNGGEHELQLAFVHKLELARLLGALEGGG